ncbi:hypothetical protein PBAL39_18054 [Pedobacter sp. BAL39]|nr:hypothetical protein PBAL39_18054 [Pedobacter sp. BAL39]
MAYAIGLAACSPTADYKKERDEVMVFHDKVMADHGVIVENQMKLDTLTRNLADLKLKFPDLDTLKEKEHMVSLIAELSAAEEQMNTWMHQFEPDVTGKSNDESISYFKNEKLKIQSVDSLYKKEIKVSGAYLNKYQK